MEADISEEEDYWEREEEEVRPNLRHDDDVKTSTKRSSRERGRSHERKGRSLNSHGKMATPSPYSNHSPGRGRTPSPKRSPAPAPPNPLRCPSPAPKAVSTNDVLPSDIQGWLTDTLRGRRVWCAVADMLFCVFEQPDSKVSKQVLLLPGCKVRQVEFKTASRDNRLVNGMGRKFKSKTISGVDKFQFWIENGTKRQRLMFGVDTKEELEQWIEVLTRVASVDTDSLAAEDEDAGRENEETGSDGGGCVRGGGGRGRGGRGGGGGDSDSEGGLTPRYRSKESLKDSDGGLTPRSRSTESLKDPARSRASSGVSENSLVDDCVGRGRSYTPTQNLPRRIDFLSMSLGNARDVSKGSVDDIRRKLRREHEYTQEPKTAPLKATYAEPDTPSKIPAPTTRRRSFFRVGGFESLFSRTKKRSASADDAKGRKTLKDNPPLKSGSTPPSPEMTRKEKRKLTRTGSEELPKEGSDEKTKEGRAFLSRSWDTENSSRGLGASIRRSASDLRSRLFSSSDKSRGPGLRLADLSDFRFQGYLHYKGRVRWVKVWAVLCRGCFYGFKSERPEETPLLVFVLPQCTVSYVSDSDAKKTKKLFAFKLSQPHCRSLSLCADNHHDLMTWLQALQLEACKVVAEDDVISVEPDVSSVDASPRVTSAVRRTASSSSSSGVASLSPSLNGNGNSEYWKTKGMRNSTVSEGSNHSFESDESGLVSGSSTLTSSSHLSPEMTSEGNDVSPRTLTPRSAKSSPRNSGGGWSLAEELKRRHGLVALEDTNLNLQTDGDNASSCGSSASQPNTPRREDALTQVWSKDKGYLLQLIRTKLLRRKKRGGKELAEGGGIYNKELARSHEGGLLIQHDEDVLLDSNKEVLLGEVRHRSRSFTEGKSLQSNQPPSPPGWKSTPATPRDWQNDDADDVSGQYDIIEGGDVAASAAQPTASSFVTHPRQRRVSDDGVTRGVTSYDSGVVSKRQNGVEGVDRRSGVEHDNDDDNDCEFSDVDGGESTRHAIESEQRVQVSTVEHTRTYSAAWDEYESEEESASDSITNNNNSLQKSKLTKEESGHGDSAWVSVTPNDTSAVTLRSAQAKTRSSELKSRSHDSDETARASTLPRERPATLFSSLNQATSSSSVQREQSSLSRLRDEDSGVYSSSETLGRKPRGPALSYYQRTRESENSDSFVTTRESLLRTSREQTLAGPRKSTAEPQRSVRQSTADSVRGPRSASAGPAQRKSTTAVPQRPSNLPTSVTTQANRNSTTAIPESPRKSSRSTPQSPRSPSQGPLQSPRKSSSGIPVTSRSSSAGPPQSPRGTPSSIPTSPRESSKGPPTSPRSPSSGPPQSPRTQSEKPAEDTKGRRGSTGINRWSAGISRGFEKVAVSSGESPRRSAEIPRESDGNFRSSDGNSRGSEGKLKKEKGKGKRSQPMAVMELAAKDLQSPAMHGYLHRKTFSDQWVRYWYALQDGCLYCYLTPDDRVTVDVTDLDGYTVTSQEDKFPGQRFVLHLDHEDYIPVYLSASSREELEDWNSALTSTIKAMPPMNGHDPHDNGEAHAGRLSEERVLSIKHKLLTEVLRQKQELEKKQAARLASKHKQMSLDESEMSYPGLTVPAPNPIPTGEQICTLTRLRQRRMSTQIKMDTLQKHIHSNGHTTKKSRFTFGKKKPPSGGEDPHAPHNPDVVEQLKTLSDHLSAIDRDLVQNGGVRTLDRKLSRGRKSGSRLSQDFESSSVEASGSGGGARSPRLSGVDSVLNEDSGIIRSNSLKSSMQKLAHKTFARAGWYRGKKSSQESSIDRDDGDDRPSPVSEDGNLNHAPDVIDLSHRLMRTWPAREASQDSEEGNGETFLPPPTSFNGADTPSPVSSPRSMRSTESTSSDKGQGQRNSSSGSSQRCHDDPRTPRRQVDPNAMATIEAFEEMSRQILGEAPT